MSLARLLVLLLSLLGFYVPGNRLYECPDRKPPQTAPQGCQVVRLTVPAVWRLR